MIFEYIFWAFAFYWLFRFVFNFVVPVFRVTRQMKEQVRDFNTTASNQRFNEPTPQYNNNNTSSSAKAAEKPKMGDYIDFEEVK